MSITPEDSKAILRFQQIQFEAAKTRLLESLTRLTLQPPSPTESTSLDVIANSIMEFHYDPGAGLVQTARRCLQRRTQTQRRCLTCSTTASISSFRKIAGSSPSMKQLGHCRKFSVSVPLRSMPVINV
ncbi:hypothetical protein P879_05471 [Paragonimus westermani]|uniref:Uncharacterized protein n=1 Tax=Paragonimus westermani TaxID=34504 RepID=A0A8T0D3B1_9TREM|nr:hypothetical protein P879_05471 [Paragonimus westermani]